MTPHDTTVLAQMFFAHDMLIYMQLRTETNVDEALTGQFENIYRLWVNTGRQAIDFERMEQLASAHGYTSPELDSTNAAP